MNNITLEEAKRWMSLDERKLKKMLVNLLKDDGKGHKHAKYAARLADFDINIIPNKPNEPPVTAAISFKTGVITIGEGLVNNPQTFYQLPTVIRHEMAHNLLMHEIRMLKHVGAEDWEIWSKSPSLHEVLNWIMDYEISNKKYTDYDKDIMRKLIINGKAIPCLVTDDIRDAWKKLSLEEMYELMTQELETLHDRLEQNLMVDTSDGHHDILTSTMSYKAADGSSMIPGKLSDFVAGGGKIRTATGVITVAEIYLQTAKAIFDNFEQYTPSPDEIEKLIEEIVKTSPLKFLDLLNPVTGEVIIKLGSPEQKAFAIEVLKKYRTDYTTWYKKVTDLLLRQNYSASAIKEIFKKVKEIRGE